MTNYRVPSVLIALLAACGTDPGANGGDDVEQTDATDVSDTVEDATADTGADAPDSTDAGGADTDVADTEDAGPACLYDDPRQSWVARSVEGCSVIDYDCSDEFVPFSNECGCGCAVPTRGNCDAERFTTSGMAEPFAIGARCEFLVFCSAFETVDELSANVLPAFPDANCTAETDYACPAASSGPSCLIYVEELDAHEVAEACERTNMPAFDGFVCAGDL